MACRYLYKEFLPFAAMVAVECALVGLDTVYKAASSRGLSYYVFIFYSYAISTLLLLLPLPFIFRGKAAELPPFNLSLFFRIFLLGLIGVLADVLGYKGLEYSSPTLSSAMANLIPSFTFAMAVCFRMERLDLRISSTRAKIIGTVVSMAGALVVTLYKGPTVLPAPSSTSISLQKPNLGSPQSNWVVGGLLLGSSTLLYSFWYIIQTKVIEMYPAEFVVVFIYCLCATVLSAPVCLVAETDLSAWRLRPDVTLVAVMYSGVVGYFFTNITLTWGLHLKGPVYIAAFKPLAIGVAAIMSFVFLSDPLHLGSVIGIIILSTGFYAVLWGKAKEEKTIDYSFGTLQSSTSGRVPLLPDH